MSTATTSPSHHTRTAETHGLKRRLPALDVLRGIAILGTLLTNIWIFSTPRSVGGGLPTDMIPDAAQNGLATIFQTGLGLVTDGKFIGLLTIMFGIGLEIQRQAALRRGETWPGRYPWRAAILVLDGLLNYIFIFEFDVLMGYGLTALAVSAIMISSPKAQKIWMIAGLTVHVLVIAGMDLVQLLFQFLVEIPDKTEFLNDSAVGDRAAAAEGSAAGAKSTDSYWAMVQDRLNDFVGGRMEIPIMFFMGIGLFLVGAHLYRAGIFDERGRKLRLWIMALAFGAGVPVDWACRLLAPDYTGAITRYITSTLVAFGILAAVAAFYARKTDTGILGTAFSAVGKMALTCYILQNLVASIIFYDWGFGVANRIAGENTVWWTMLIYLGIAGFLIGLSLVWLRFFKRGPVEWLWHGMFDGISFVLDRRQQRIQSR